jgi:hypothetical protein
LVDPAKLQQGQGLELEKRDIPKGDDQTGNADL